jgi:hypothetical protein
MYWKHHNTNVDIKISDHNTFLALLSSDTLKDKQLEYIAYLFQNILVNLPKGSMTCQRVSLIEHGNPYEIPGCTPGVLVSS